MPTVIFIAILAFSAIYAPQPLLPVLAAEFGVSRDMVAALTTIAFLPLSIAPLVYGYILELFTPKQLLRVAVLLLAISEFIFLAGESFGLLLAVRLFQGLLIPAILTALMTYVSIQSEAANVRRAMAIYIASTILGGFLGRALSGTIATLFGWRYSFLILGISLLVGFFMLQRLEAGRRLEGVRPSPYLAIDILREKRARQVYQMVFCFFFVFAAIMNFLPFRVTEIDAGASELRIGFMYSGYLLGVVTALNAVRISDRFGSTVGTIVCGLAGFAMILLGMVVPSVPWLFVLMFLFCGTLFLVHSLASGYLNSEIPRNKGMVNGLYVAFYYAGGMFGSSLPGFVYHRYGWSAFIGSLLLVLLYGLLMAVRLWRTPAQTGRQDCVSCG